ncbi:MAG: hypothetical protein QXX36_03750 [Candidatus Rehaiarchaeum fermentans]|nr:hypothetical protein [Candidatus Rehaiarchaeum fermentans]
MSSCQYGINVLGTTVCFDPIVDPIINGIVDPVESFFQSLLSQVENDLLSVLNDIYDAISNAFGQVYSFLQQLGQTIESTVSNALQNVANAVSNAMQNAASTILNAFITAGNDIRQFFGQVGNTIMGGINDIQNFLSSTVLPQLEQIPNDFVQGITTLANEVEQGLNDVKNFLSTTFNDIANALNNAFDALRNDIVSVINEVINTIEQGLNDVKNFFSQLGTHILDGLQTLAQQLQTAFSTVINDLTSAFNDILKGLESIGEMLFNAIKDTGSVVVSALKTFGTDAYDALKVVTQDILAGLNDIVRAIENAFKDIPMSLLQQIQGFNRANIQDQFAKLVSFLAIPAATYIGTTLGVKVIENLHPFHELHIQEFSDKIMEMFAVDTIPEKVMEGIVEFGVFKPLEYSLNFLLRPKISDLAIETRALIYGYETEDELRQALAIEGYTDDLIDKYIKTIYRPLSPFVLRYLIETGLASKDFVLRQLQMEGFPPDEVPTILNIFEALDLVPFQNQAKAVIYQYYRDGLMDENTARNIMNVFQIPKVQQDWILAVAKTDFELSQKTQLVQLTLDLLARAEINVDQCINTLVKIGVNPDRAKTQCNIRAITAAPPPPKSTRAMLLQEAIQNLGALFP